MYLLVQSYTGKLVAKLGLEYLFYATKRILHFLSRNLGKFHRGFFDVLLVINSGSEMGNHQSVLLNKWLEQNQI